MTSSNHGLSAIVGYGDPLSWQPPKPRDPLAGLERFWRCEECNLTVADEPVTVVVQEAERALDGSTYWVAKPKALCGHCVAAARNNQWYGEEYFPATREDDHGDF